MTEDLDRDIRDGERVEMFLRDEAVIRAFAKVEEQYTARWKQAKTRETREELWAKQDALADVMAKLRETVGNKEMAKAKKDQQEKLARATARKGQ